MNEHVRRHVGLIAATLAVLVAAGVGYALRSGGSAHAQSARAVGHVHTIAPLLAAASQQRATGSRSFVAASASPHQPAPAAARTALKRPAQPGVPTPAPSSRGVALALKRVTGLTPAQVTSRPVCPRAAAGHARCTAQTLVLRSSGAPVRPHVTKSASLGRVAPTRRRGAHAASIAAASPPTPGTPAYLQQAYDVTALAQTGGSGDTVAVVDAYDDPTAEADLNAYRANYGLPACTTATGCFRKVNQGGAPSPLPAADAGWEMETSLDLDAISALCPNCHILLVEANSAGSPDLSAAMATSQHLGANQISASWTLSQSTPPAGTYTFPGVATVAAAGDTGYTGTSADNYPAGFPGVTAAGGTSLAPATATSPRGFGEAAWSLTLNSLTGTSTGGGSGCDVRFPRPVYQPAAGCGGRAYADLSAEADPKAGGLAVYDSAAPNDHWIVMGGTSLATPLIAAYYAITGVGGATPQWAYGAASSLNDVVSGSSGNCAAGIAYICNAGPGYDGPTGVGSISGAVVAGAPGIGGPSLSGGSNSPNTYTQSVGSQSATIAGGIYRNGLDTTWWIQYGPTNAYGSQTTATDIGAGSAPVAITGSLSHLTPATTYHYRLVAQNSLGTTYGYDYTLGTAAATAPSAAFAVSPSAPSPSARTFDASGSTPGSGSSITSYTWSFGDGTVVDSGTNPTASHTYNARNNYTVTLTVKNSAGQSSTSIQTVTVDNPPTAAFSPSATFAAPGTAVSFNGGASTADPGGAIRDYSWNFGDGTVQDTGSTPTVAHTYASPGTYSVVLTTTDDLDVASSTSTLITVDQPSATFTTGPPNPAPGTAVSFNGAGSTDPRGTIIDYDWSFGDGTVTDSGTNPTASHTYPARNNYTVTLTVTNNHNQTSVSTQTVRVDNPPAAAFTPSATLGVPGTMIDFDGSASTAGTGGTISAYTWSFGDGAGDIGSHPGPHTYTRTGTYTVSLTVTDDLGATATASQQVVIDQPTAAFTIAPANPVPGGVVTLNATGSTDPQGTISDYSWNFGDGTTDDSGASPTATHPYALRNRYPVTLTITNNHGQKSTVSQSVTVDDPPTTAFTASPTSTTPGAAVSFNASASRATNGGSITDYRWDFGDGSTAVDTGASAAAAHTFATAGTYTVTLTATDDLGIAASAATHVVVAAPATPSPSPVTPAPPVSTPSPPAPPQLVAALGGAGKQRLAYVLAHGLRLALAVNQPAGASLQITIRPPHSTRAVVLLRGVRRLGAGGNVITLKLSRAAARRLTATGSLSLTVRVTLTGAGGATLTRTAKITLIR